MKHIVTDECHREEWRSFHCISELGSALAIVNLGKNFTAERSLALHSNVRTVCSV